MGVGIVVVSLKTNSGEYICMAIVVNAMMVTTAIAANTRKRLLLLCIQGSMSQLISGLNIAVSIVEITTVMKSAGVGMMFKARL